MNYLYILLPLLILFLIGLRIVQSNERGLIERLGKYHDLAYPGFHWIIPFIDTLHKVKTTRSPVNNENPTAINNDKTAISINVYFKPIAANENRRKSARTRNNQKWKVAQFNNENGNEISYRPAYQIVAEDVEMNNMVETVGFN